MHDRDAVIRHAAEAARNYATQVQSALADYLRLGAPAIGALRDALVAQSVGFEGVAHDGSSCTARVDAAKAALAAWDGPSDKRGLIRLGSRVVRCDIALAVQAGWEHPHSDSIEIRAPHYYPELATADLARALGEFHALSSLYFFPSISTTLPSQLVGS